MGVATAQFWSRTAAPLSSILARDEDKLARRMDDGSHISAASMPSFAASTTGRHPTHVNVKGCSSTWQACLDPRWVGAYPRTRATTFLAGISRGRKRVLARPQPVKVEADDVAGRRSREQAGSPSVIRLTALPLALVHTFAMAARYRGERQIELPFQQCLSRPFWQANRSRQIESPPASIRMASFR